MNQELDALRKHICALEQQLSAAKYQLEVTLSAADESDPGLALVDENERVAWAMRYVNTFQETTRPVVWFDGMSGRTEISVRPPQPKEISCLGAACDFLERFFDSHKENPK